MPMSGKMKIKGGSRIFSVYDLILKLKIKTEFYEILVWFGCHVLVPCLVKSKGRTHPSLFAVETTFNTVR